MNTYLDIVVQRFYELNNNTFGYFKIYNKLFFTVEDTTKILPSGEYDCKIVKSSTNKSIGLDFCYGIIENIPNRDGFRFMHIANTHKDVDGCLGGGLVCDISLGMILKSKEAIRLFYGLLKEKIDLKPIHICICGEE